MFRTRNKIIYVLFLLLTFVAIVSGAFFSTRSKPQVQQNTTDQKIVSIPPAVCKNSSTVEYLHYKQLPEDQLRNNKFGIYIYAEVDKYFKLAEELVNSSGGDWGYVLIPFNVKDRDYTKWRNAFKQLSSKHLIPIIQLWAVDPEDYKNDTKESADFLDSFVWPIRERYISVYNETNDAKFWNNKIDPAGYAKVLDYTIKEFKKQNSDFFIMNGAFNVSAPVSQDYMDSFTYMKIMNNEVPDIFEKLDGWASHSYPQPNFSGNPKDTGRSSIRAYENELQELKTLGVKKDLPVFITETGWAHAEGNSVNYSYLEAQQVADNYKTAYTDVWLKDDRVRAVIPFTIRYDPPFDHFSWLNQDNVPYKQYDVVKSIPKVAGVQETLESGTVSQVGCPE